MSEIAVRVDRLAKSYLVGHYASQVERYTALRDVIARQARDLARKTRDMFHGKAIIQGDEVEEFWALKDVSFEIRQGDRVGVIGRNGAGKSTLLKILSRITEPSQGRVEIHGRVASLLEVGTGFHPELSGRENVFLNGAILGMGRREIQRKFDEIVAFAEVERFLDTPVKRYSSGMYVRLAFSVAAHLEPEILIVDEVLAVGDIQFQKKCLGKMQDVADDGRTVIFVSHNLQAIRHLCSSGIVLSAGRIVCNSNIDEAITSYHKELATLQVGKSTHGQTAANRRGSGAARFTAIRVAGESGAEGFSFKMGESVIFDLQYEAIEDLKTLSASIALKSGSSSDVITSFIFPVSTTRVPAGACGHLQVRIPDVRLRPGNYRLYFWLGDGEHFQPYDVVDDLTLPLSIRLNPDVADKDIVPLSPIGHFSHPSKVILSTMTHAK